MRRAGPFWRTRGFTLLEVLVAGIVLAVGAVVVLETISSSLSAAGALHRRAAGREIAADLLSKAAAGAMADLPQTGEQWRDGIVYRWTVRLLPAGDGPLQRLSCTVEWVGRSAGRPTRSVTLDRLWDGPAETLP